MTGLLILIRSALENRPLDGPDFHSLCQWDGTTWEHLLEQAQEQTVIGLVYHAVSLLPPETPVPEDIVFKLVAEGESIADNSRSLETKARALIRKLSSAGLHPHLLKGPETARFYPCPLLRGYGDIDLYLPKEETSTALATLQSEGFPVWKDPDRSFHFDFLGTDVDVHPRFYDLHGPSERLPDPSSAEGTLLMLSAHVLKHAMGTGIGLRQLCDVAAAFRALEGQYDPETYLRSCRLAGILRWTRLLHRFLAEYLGVPDRLFPDNHTSPVPLLKMVTEGGNFGHHARGRQEALERSPLRRKADTALRFLRHLPFSLLYAPGEVLPRIWELMRENGKILPRRPE